MTKADVPALMRLKEAAGWNQTPADWELVMELEPEGCWVEEREGEVAGATTVIRYGTQLAWVGMVLTLPKFRRRGIARGLMTRAVEYCDENGVECVKLDATDMGRPLYLQLGFVDEAPIERWRRVGGEDYRLSLMPLPKQPHLDHLDGTGFGVERAAAIDGLVRVSTFVAGDRSGYVMARPGSNADFVGPCIAESRQKAEELIRAAIAQPPGRDFFWDLLPGNREAVSLAESLGFEPVRKLTRMARPAVREFGDPSLVWGIAGFEYG